MLVGRNAEKLEELAKAEQVDRWTPDGSSSEKWISKFLDAASTQPATLTQAIRQEACLCGKL